MTTKPALESDLARIAECHISAFPKSLSSALGKRYVAKMLGWYLSSDRTFLFYGDDQARVVGYCGGMIKEGSVAMGSASGMAQYSFDEAVRAFLVRPWLVFHPELRAKYLFVAKNLWRRVTRSGNGSAGSATQSSTPIEPYVALVVIGVRMDEQGKGYGSLLLQEFERIALQRGYKKMLLTVLSDNHQAIKSYERNGWRKTEEKKNSTTMIKKMGN